MDAIEEASNSTFRAKVIVKLVRIGSIVCEGIHSFNWSEKFEILSSGATKAAFLFKQMLQLHFVMMAPLE
jgi:hypothetical protein